MSQPQDQDDVDPRVAARKRVEQALRVHIADIQWLMSSKRGRRIVWQQLSTAGVFHQTFNTNAMQMAFAEGKRSTGLDLLGLVMKAAPDQYMPMTTENTSSHEHGND